MDARRRALPTAIGLLFFVALGRLADSEFWTQWWFFVGLATAISVTFVEPFFSRPQDGLINSLGGVAAFFTVDRRAVDPLWFGYLVVCSSILAASLYAVLSREAAPVTSLKWLANRVASRLGRAHLVGFAALLVELLSRADARIGEWQYLAFAVGALLVALAVNWHQLLSGVVRRSDEGAYAVAALGPRLLFVAGPDPSVPIGQSLAVTGKLGTTEGFVTGRMSHSEGVRYEIALGVEWSQVCGSFPEEITLKRTESDAAVVGVAREGSTDTSIVFRPLRRLGVGDALRIEAPVGDLLYQVTAVQLDRASWTAAHALVEAAEARQVGRITDEGRIELRPYLPSPHQPLLSPGPLSSTLPDGYARVGVVRGSNVVVGLASDSPRRAHIAVLGMSGMGKTAVAHRLAAALGRSSLVVAVDTTGEYRSRLRVGAWNEDLSVTGHFVQEPTGEPALRCRQLVETFMTAGSEEYLRGEEPRPRVLLLEEAHSFIPEWNFAGRAQQDHVNETCRMIMQARKFRLSFIVVSQRTAVVSKSALSQCENYIVLKTIDETSLSYMEAIVGSDMRRAISSLRRYEALCVGPDFNADGPVIVVLDIPDSAERAS